ncbi:MAG: hypothetical protein JO218_11930 [Burkholderiales bacterium]|nr:hypothetical protein [Burkholderiales bacterium]
MRSLLCVLLAAAVQASDVEAWWDFDHPKDSEQRFRQEVAVAEQNGDLNERGELMSQIARAQAMQGQFKAAQETLDQLQQELPKLAPIVSVRFTLEQGRMIQALGDPKRAWRWYHAALQLAQKNKLDFFAIDAMHMMALTEKGQAALDWNLKAAALAEHSDAANADDWLGSLYNNVGWLYYDLKDYDKSLAYLKRAQAWHEAHGSDRPLLIARWGVAKLLRLTGESAKALAIQLDLERAWKQHGTEDGFVYEEVAEGYFTEGNIDKAREYYSKAYEVMSKDTWLAQRDPAHLARLKKLANQ